MNSVNIPALASINLSWEVWTGAGVKYGGGGVDGETLVYLIECVRSHPRVYTWRCFNEVGIIAPVSHISGFDSRPLPLSKMDNPGLLGGTWSS